PAMAPLAAALAAPLRYHHCGVSPAGWVIVGTSTRSAAAELSATEGEVLAQAAGSRALSRARGRARLVRGIAGPEGRMPSLPGLRTGAGTTTVHAWWDGRALSASVSVMPMTRRRSSGVVASAGASGYRSAFAAIRIDDEPGQGLAGHSLLAARAGWLRAGRPGRMAAGTGGADVVRAAGHDLRQPDPDDRGAAGAVRGGQRGGLAARAEVGGRPGRAHLPVVRRHRRA